MDLSDLAEILAQPSGHHGEMHVISYASRSVTPAESRYSQIELETLACVFACECFYRYIYGEDFDLVTDNKALEFILGNTNAKHSARIERLSLCLQP